jgi:hypothetical protein
MGRRPILEINARTGRRWTRLALAVAVLFAVSAPVAVFAAGGHFTDDDTSVFESNINWMADNGITVGCNPPGNDHYCPNDNVTRGQMAAFMERLAENQVVDAATVDGLDASSFSRVASLSETDDVDNWNGSVITDSVDITAPVDGLLVISYVVNWAKDADETGTAWVDYYVDPKLDTVVLDRDWTGLDFSTAGSDYHNQSTTVQRVTPVGAGDHTVSMDFARLSGTSATDLGFVYRRTLIVTFMPYDGSGLSPVAAVAAESAASTSSQP